MSQTEAQINQEKFAREVCLFVAEELREDRMTLIQAGELTEKVDRNLNLLDSEEDALRFIRELKTDHEYISALEQRIYMGAQITASEKLTELVREFAVNYLPQDPHGTAEVIKAAVEENLELEQLASRFPQFKQFILEKNAKPRPN